MVKICNCCFTGKVKYKVESVIQITSLDGELKYTLPNPDVEPQYYCQKHMEENYGHKS